MTEHVDLAGVLWVKSSYSENGGACVEIAPGREGVMPVRDSKDPHGPALVFPAGAWQSFVSAAALDALCRALP